MTTQHPQATVLIVDDDVAVATALGRAFSTHGYEVEIAGDAESGLRGLGRSRPDVVVLDFRMPMINGLGFLYRLRAIDGYRRTPVLVVTGDATLSRDRPRRRRCSRA